MTLGNRRNSYRIVSRLQLARHLEFSVMRRTSLIASLTMAIGFTSSAVAPADAFGRRDPHAYVYEPRGYYPYYNSYYWRPAYEVRRKRYYALPPYYPAWGYPNPYYRHREWHRRHHGGHHIGHW